MTIAERIRDIRKYRNMTQEEVAQRAGMSGSMYRQYECEMRIPKREALGKIAEALEVDIAFLQPSKEQTPMSILGLLYNLLEDYGDVKMENKGGTVLFGIDNMKHPMENSKLQDAFRAHNKMTSDEFKKWLINYPPKVHNGKIEK